jgi:hypothetical protein
VTDLCDEPACEGVLNAMASASKAVGSELRLLGSARGESRGALRISEHVGNKYILKVHRYRTHLNQHERVGG